LPAFRASVVASAPFAAHGAEEIQDWDAIKLLTVRVDRLRTWYREGLLFLGDAAHAMSPIGGVGINLAIQDAVAAANLLARPLLDGRVGIADLAAVQRRRELPTRLTQFVQVQVQRRVIARVLAKDAATRAPLFLRLLEQFPVLRRIPARLVGIGVRPEHVRTPGTLPHDIS
jgi:2-polyprenyl-6-methoxyphenol hydroxylase-like FAD-dependent oxidoreductase